MGTIHGSFSWGKGIENYVGKLFDWQILPFQIILNRDRQLNLTLFLLNLTSCRYNKLTTKETMKSTQINFERLTEVFGLSIYIGVLSKSYICQKKPAGPPPPPQYLRL